jgi:hypothetical protein
MLNQAPFMLDGASLLQGGCALGAWMLIIARILRLRRTAAANQEFRAVFLNALNLREASVVPDNRGGYARIANVGFGVLHHTRAMESDEGSLHRYALLVRNLTQQVRREHDALAGGFALLACLIGILFVIGQFRPSNSLAFDEIGIALALSVLPGFVYLSYLAKAMCAGLDDFVDDFLDLTRKSLRDSCGVQGVRRKVPAR